MYKNEKVYNLIEEILISSSVKGNVLEIGTENNESSYLYSDSLSGCNRYGVNIMFENDFIDNQINFVSANSNKMIMFQDSFFDCIICNAMLEHDKFFWKTLSEIGRILKSGGLLIIGVPSYNKLKINKIIEKFGLNYNYPISDFLRNTTFTFKKHNFPNDYYRFSEDCIKEVFFENYINVTIKTIMYPPRSIGYGFKK